VARGWSEVEERRCVVQIPREESSEPDEDPGAILPCDYMFGDESRMVESFDSNETIRPAGVVARRWNPAESIAEDSPLLIADQSRITDQSDGVILWQLLIDFGRAVRKILAKLLTSHCAC